MENGKLIQIYEVTCRKCAKVERLFKTVNVSKRHLRSLGWCENARHEWHCNECRDHASHVIVAPYRDPEKCYSNEDKS